MHILTSIYKVLCLFYNAVVCRLTLDNGISISSSGRLSYVLFILIYEYIILVH